MKMNIDKKNVYSIELQCFKTQYYLLFFMLILSNFVYLHVETKLDYFYKLNGVEHQLIWIH